MSTIYTQKYKNNIRTVSGLINIVKQDDVTLLCDTSVAPVTINLLSIPTNWSTQYKLYIVDKSNNAGTNNITINAPLGFLINGITTFVITGNGGSVLLRVVSNTDYIAQYSVVVGGGGVNGHILQNEGVNLPQRLRMNFVGAGVDAVDDFGGNQTIVNIAGGIIDLTNAQMLALVTANTVVKGQYYRITDAQFSDLGAVVMGVKEDSVSLSGHSTYFNPDFQRIGDYSGQPTFTSAMGLWSTDPQIVIIGGCVVWNNRNYINLTGAWGTAPDLDVINWSILPKSETNGYIVETDFIVYDLINNAILYRADYRGNEVDRFVQAPKANTLLDFQWGRDVVIRNKVQGRSILEFKNSNAEWRDNYFNDSTIVDHTTTELSNNAKFVQNIVNRSTLSLGNTRGLIQGNIIQDGSGLQTTGTTIILAVGSEIKFNIISNASNILVNSMSGTSKINSNELSGNSSFNLGDVNGEMIYNTLDNKGAFQTTALNNNVANCIIKQTKVNIPTVSSPYYGFKVELGYSNWVETLDLNNAGIFAGNTLTIPAIFQSYVGIFKFLNATGNSIAQIVNAPTLFPFELMPDNSVLPNVLTIIYTGVGVAIPTEIVADKTVNTYGGINTGYTGISDSTKLITDGLIIYATSKNIWN